MSDMIVILMAMTVVLGAFAVCACIILKNVCRRLADISERLRDLKSLDIDVNLKVDEEVLRKFGDVLSKPRKKTPEKAKKAGK